MNTSASTLPPAKISGRTQPSSAWGMTISSIHWYFSRLQWLTSDR